MSVESQLLKRIEQLERRVEKMSTWESVSCGAQADLFGGAPYATVVLAAYNSLHPNAGSADYVCNGSNDQDTIMEAVDANYNGRFIFLDGDFLLSNAWILNGVTNCEFMGMGKGGTRIRTQGLADTSFNTSFVSSFSSFYESSWPLVHLKGDCENITFRDMAFLGNDVSTVVPHPNSLSALWSSGTLNGFNLLDIVIHRFVGPGIHLEDIAYSQWHRVMSSYNSNDGIEVAAMLGCSIDTVQVTNNGGNGYRVDASRSSRHVHIDAWHNEGVGIMIEGIN